MPDRSTTPRPLRPALQRLAMIALLLLSGCAAAGRHTDGAGPEDFNDPIENTNRAIFRFNQKVDHAVLLPVAKGYRAALPPKVREALRHFFENLRGPIILANDMLQGNGDLAGKTAVRFVVNSTVGVAGFLDVAGRLGIPYHYQDFGLTFAVWGIGEGPYLVVPILGPSNPRDLAGTVAEAFADPWDIMAGNAHYLWAPISRHAIGGIDERSQYIDELANIERTSLDYYATIRSLYRQRRDALRHHEEKNLPPNPSLGSGAPSPAPTPAAPAVEAPVVAELVPTEPATPAPAAAPQHATTPALAEMTPAGAAPPVGGPTTMVRPKPARIAAAARAKPTRGAATLTPPGSFLALATLTPPGAPAAATLTRYGSSAGPAPGSTLPPPR